MRTPASPSPRQNSRRRSASSLTPSRCVKTPLPRPVASSAAPWCSLLGVPDRLAQLEYPSRSSCPPVRYTQRRCLPARLGSPRHTQATQLHLPSPGPAPAACPPPLRPGLPFPCRRRTLGAPWSMPWSRTTPGQPPSCASWTSQWMWRATPGPWMPPATPSPSERGEGEAGGRQAGAAAAAAAGCGRQNHRQPTPAQLHATLLFAN